MSIFQTLCKHFYKNDTKTIYIVDVLYMKDINAIYGFENGDYILTQLYNLLKKNIKEEILLSLERRLCIEIKKQSC